MFGCKENYVPFYKHNKFIQERSYDEYKKYGIKTQDLCLHDSSIHFRCIFLESVVIGDFVLCPIVKNIETHYETNSSYTKQDSYSLTEKPWNK